MREHGSEAFVNLGRIGFGRSACNGHAATPAGWQASSRRLQRSKVFPSSTQS